MAVWARKYCSCTAYLGFHFSLPLHQFIALTVRIYLAWHVIYQNLLVCVSYGREHWAKSGREPVWALGTASYIVSFMIPLQFLLESPSSACGIWSPVNIDHMPWELAWNNNSIRRARLQILAATMYLQERCPCQSFILPAGKETHGEARYSVPASHSMQTALGRLR